jgi:hypothetical protein
MMTEQNAIVKDPRGELAKLLGFSSRRIDRAWRTYLYSHNVPRTEQDLQDALPWFRKKLGLLAMGVPGE